MESSGTQRDSLADFIGDGTKEERKRRSGEKLEDNKLLTRGREEEERKGCFYLKRQSFS
jgi:hypothetical protein